MQSRTGVCTTVVSLRSLTDTQNKPPPRIWRSACRCGTELVAPPTGLVVSLRSLADTSKQTAAATLSGGAPAGAEQNWWTPQAESSPRVLDSV